MASNGTTPSADTSSSTLSEQAARKRARSESPDRAYSLTVDSPSHYPSSDTEIHISDSSTKGRPSSLHRAPPVWDARALLNPKAARAPSTSAPNLNAAASRANGQINPAQTFQFAPPNSHVTSIDLTDDDATDVQPIPNGAGSMIERINNVESRAALPEPKRRKINTPEADLQQSAVRGGSGMLSGYIQGQENGAIEETGAAKPKPHITVDLTDNNESDTAASDPGLQEVCFGTIEIAMVNCHRVPAPRPAAMLLGGDGTWPLIKAVLKRRVGDQTSTVAVYDHTREVFGHLDAKTAFALAPLIDSSVLQFRSDCRIPPRPRQPDENAGEPISRSYRIEITIYGRRKYAKTVGRVLREKGLRLKNPGLISRGVILFNPHVHYPAASTSAPARPSQSQQHTSYSPAVAQKTVEEVRADVLGVFDTLSSRDLPQLSPGPEVLTELLPHQKQGLCFLVARETQDPQRLGSLWKERRVHGGHLEYYNVITQQSQTSLPEPTLGGILADMMGLGKTLSILSLLVTTLDKAQEWAGLVPEQPSAPDRRKASSSKFNAPMPEPLALTKLKMNSKATLLVCPLSTVTNWEEQIKQHIKPGTVKYHIYHGQNRIKDPKELAKFDLVITTYGSVSSELTSRLRRKVNKLHPLEEIGWFRIVLDEAHMIREQSTLQFKAICRLQASRRWAVTGTPVQNRLDDLAALLAFIRLKPFDDRNKFNQHIVAPFKLADPEIIPKLRILVDTVTLRRLKDKIDLPSRQEMDVSLCFAPDEQRLYNLFNKNAKDRVQALTGTRERILGGKTYIHILQSILRLRLICAHGRALLSDEDLRAVEGMTQDSAIDIDSDDETDKPAMTDEQAYKFYDLMKDTNSDTCVVCERKLGSNTEETDIQSESQEDVLGYMTPCFHVYCPNCIKHHRDDEHGVSHSNHNNQKGTCPVCKHMVSFATVELRRTRADVEHEKVPSFKGKGYGSKNLENYTGPHTKTRQLVQDLLETRNRSREIYPNETPIKSVVFSGWTSHLDLIEIALDNAGITHTRLDGKMARPARTLAMDRFREDPTVEVILVSIMAGGLGLNLTAGSDVYVMEPQYNPAAEAQAVDRVHRLGQKREVRIFRYIMKDSFEEQMVALQKKKIALANLSMDRGAAMDKRDAARQRLIDLKDLFK